MERRAARGDRGSRPRDAGGPRRRAAGRARRRVSQSWAVGRPMSVSEPMRTRVTRPSASSSKFTLTLAQHPEERALERTRGQDQLGAVGVAHDDAFTALRVVHPHDALHRRPPLRASGEWGPLDLACLEAGGADVDALRCAVDDGPDALHVGVPAPLGARRCEWLRRMPNCGFLPHTSQTDAIALPRSLALISPPGGTGKATSDRSTIPAVGVLQSLAPADLRRVVSTYRDALRNHQEELNRLNVYPVPDGDTGTNMALTLESVVGELPGRRLQHGAGLRGDPARFADGGPRELGRDPLADPPGPRRHVRAARVDLGPRCGRRSAACRRRCVRSRAPAGRGNDPHRRPARGRSRRAGVRERRGDAERRARTCRERGARRRRQHTRPVAGAPRRRGGRRRWARIRAPARRLPQRRCRTARPRAGGGVHARGGCGAPP